MKISERLSELNIPDVLLFSGKEVRTGTVFDATRASILALLENEEYGKMPGAPEKMWVSECGKADTRICAGKAVRREFILHGIHEGREYSFPFHSLIPTATNGKLPAFVMINFSDAAGFKYYPAEEIIDRGFAVFGVDYQAVTADNDDFTSGIADVLVNDRTSGDAPGKLTIWAYAVIRIIDYVETLSDIIDMEHLAVCGHSRLGKTTLLAAAHDERIKFACANDSGTSGDALVRGSVGEKIDDITDKFPYWFCPNYLKYRSDALPLPFDQHYLLSLIVPRHIVLASALEDTWADPRSQFLSLVLTNKVYNLYNKQGLIHPAEIPTNTCRYDSGDSSFYTRAGKHYFSREDWNYFIDYILTK